MLMKKVLIADDEEGVRLALASTLEKRFEVLLANDGRQALSIALQEKPELILLDIDMPNMNGMETLAQLTAVKGNWTIIIMLSSTNDMETVRKALAMGACEYITKPFDALQVKNIVENKLGITQNDTPWKISS